MTPDEMRRAAECLRGDANFYPEHGGEPADQLDINVHECHHERLDLARKLDEHASWMPESAPPNEGLKEAKT